MTTIEDLHAAALSGDVAHFHQVLAQYRRDNPEAAALTAARNAAKAAVSRAVTFEIKVNADGVANLYRNEEETPVYCFGKIEDEAVRQQVKERFQKGCILRPDAMRHFATLELKHDVCPICGRDPNPMLPVFNVRDVRIERCHYCMTSLIVDQTNGEIRDISGKLAKRWVLTWK